MRLQRADLVSRRSFAPALPVQDDFKTPQFDAIEYDWLGRERQGALLQIDDERRLRPCQCQEIVDNVAPGSAVRDGPPGLPPIEHATEFHQLAAELPLDRLLRRRPAARLAEPLA